MGRLLRACAFCCLSLLASAVPAAAQPHSWMLPAGGETWTAGTTHTILWSGGPAGNANVYLVRLVPFQFAGLIALGTANDGVASWSIPGSLAPGGYLLYIEDPGQTTWTYGPSFTINAAPVCASNCVLTSSAMPVAEPPLGACGSTAADAANDAQAWAQANLHCTSGRTIDPASLVVDVTPLPFGACLAGYGGAFIAEASAVACCCAEPTPARPSTWGRVKTVYR